MRSNKARNGRQGLAPFPAARRRVLEADMEDNEDTAVLVEADNISAVYKEIREVLVQARARAWQAVNAEMVTAYWEVGRVIVEVEQGGQERANYGTSSSRRSPLVSS